MSYQKAIAAFGEAVEEGVGLAPAGAELEHEQLGRGGYRLLLGFLGASGEQEGVGDPLCEQRLDGEHLALLALVHAARPGQHTEGPQSADDASRSDIHHLSITPARPESLTQLAGLDPPVQRQRATDDPAPVPEERIPSLAFRAQSLAIWRIRRPTRW